MTTKLIAILTVGLLLLAPMGVLAQDPEPVEPPETPEAPETPDAEPVDDPDAEPGTEEPKPLNATQQERVRRLSEASGVSEAEILQMRLRTRAADGEVPEGEIDPEAEGGPQGHGWGVIAKELGLHPGVLGKGTGDKFYPKDDVDLPSLPELPEGAEETAKKAHDKAIDRAAKVRGYEKDTVKEARGKGRDKRDKARERIENKGRDKDKGKPDKDKPDKPEKDTPKGRDK